MTTRVLLTNDDGIHAEGLQALRRALVRLPGIDLRVVAPDGNRSATARAITVRRPLVVQDVPFDDGTVGIATDGMPTDCVRLAAHGVIDGWHPDLVVSGINHGANLGEDVTYSGTVAAALEAVIHDLPGVALSMASPHGEWSLRREHTWDFSAAAEVGARIVAELDRGLLPGTAAEAAAGVPLPERTILNVNVPLGALHAVEVTRLGRRRYSDELKPVETLPDGRRSYWLYGMEHGFEPLPGTDLAAVAAGRVSITPLHLDLTHETAIAPLEGHGFEGLLDRLGELVED
ncbi:5-nucleotidase SurE [Patulibacter medicamentivorans]|uniref:5'-nucleotidase SurE n=1 Tax=Patulibacter medicamentivorans TaxID=1097667 RepID=H0E8S0_9ACTN|nr:5'/3'-nucleotidase SurE [Patulibacter medicamentivorans]EHN09948.1 5-nucleotidase SurE [Patulibacter medicamentivorans]